MFLSIKWFCIRKLAEPVLHLVVLVALVFFGGVR